jgi:ankyrin repeat protein
VLISLLAANVTAHAAPIHDAASAGDLERIQKLVVKGANVNAKAVRGETPLMIAALSGQGEIVNYLLQRGADISARNSSGMTALHAATYGGYTDIVLLLISKGADVNDAANRFGVTPLHLASEENHVETVIELLRHHADTGSKERNGYTPLSRAGWRENWAVVETLLASGATCQEEDIVGDWLYKECTTRANAN